MRLLQTYPVKSVEGVRILEFLGRNVRRFHDVSFKAQKIAVYNFGSKQLYFNSSYVVRVLIFSFRTVIRILLTHREL